MASKSYSPVESNPNYDAEKVAKAKRCVDEGVLAGVKAAGIAAVASAIPTLVGVRTVPWARAHLNYTAQALIVSAATVATYFIVAEQTIMECTRTTSRADVEAARAARGA
eukprot:jgi/Mesen1/8845/ME000053S08248